MKKNSKQITSNKKTKKLEAIDSLSSMASITDSFSQTDAKKSYWAKIISKSKTVKFLPIEPYSWAKRLTIFVSIFSGLWLILEPLSVFGIGTGFVQKSGLVGYSLLITLAVAGELISEYWNRNRAYLFFDTIKIQVVIKRMGTRINAEVSKDMLISQFLELFLKRGEEFMDKKWHNATKEFCDFRLVLIRDDKIIELPQAKTFFEIGTKDGDLFSILVNQLRFLSDEAARY